MVNLSLALLDTTDRIIYCVIPNESSLCLYDDCHNQQCATWEYYVEYLDQPNQQPADVTIIFMNGIHEAKYSVKISSQNITMMGAGESQNIVIQGYYSAIFFVNNIHVTIKNLTFDNTYISVSPTWKGYEPLETHFQFESVNMIYSTLKAYIEGVIVDLFMHFTRCNFYHGTSLFGDMKVNFTDCELVNNTMTLAGTALRISGVSKVSNSALTSAITCYFCPITLSGTISFINNTAVRGGAMLLHTTTLYVDANTNVTFANNTAKDRGGAIFVEPNLPPYPLDNSYILTYCFYQTLNCNSTSYHNIHFDNNLAINGGDDIYGSTSETYCLQLDKECSVSMIHKSYYDGHSSISSDPTRICLCDYEGLLQCQNRSYFYGVHPGEMFTISAVVIGGDFGTTVGTVHAGFLNPIAKSYFLRPISQYGQAIESTHCTTLNYTVYTNQTNSTTVMYLSSQQKLDINDVMFYAHYDYYTPVFVNITILPCPPGFILTKDPPRCSCYKALTNKHINCNISDGIGYISWNGNMWMSITFKNSITYTDYCPHDYCIVNGKRIDLERDPDSQCAFNRAGRLCGGCKDGYSLAIGSSHCIHCPNSNNLALVIFFAAAGFLLVFFIGALNLTVSQGMINGLIFYANIVWIYDTTLFPQEQKANGVLLFLRIFVAWINLDFGIEACFVSGLTAFWKIWLQFLFPLYILAIAVVTVVAVTCSTKLSNLVGNRVISALATICLLSYMKFMRIIVATMNPSTITEYPSGSEITLWTEDGNLNFFGFPHILLFIAGLSTALFCLLPYTLILSVKQCIQRMLPARLLRCFRRFRPFFDTYFVPLKHKHQYWFGLLLLARWIILICYSSTLSQDINLLILFIAGVILLFHMTATLPYRNTSILVVNGSFLTNLALLSGFALFTETNPLRSTLRTVMAALSIGLAFLTFCCIVIYEIIALRYLNRKTVSNMMSSVASLASKSFSNNDERQPLLKAQGSDRVTATY